MPSTYYGRSIHRSPEFALYKKTTTAADSGPYTEKKHGVATDNWLETIVDVSSTAPSNPVLTFMFWSEKAGKFVEDVDIGPTLPQGPAAAFQKRIPTAGRIMFIAVTGAIDGGVVTISVAGTELEHP